MLLKKAEAGIAQKIAWNDVKNENSATEEAAKKERF